ncbi:MAG TPA: hypothetical protein VN437_02910, partial [Rectinemataceae bacterium]|nr:hypothetical protein [Rectinemataceae bacterium]
QGFHSSWISSHPSIASGATNTAEFVKKSGWVSAVLHEGGYLELIVRATTEQRLRDCLWNLLSSNEASLDRVVVMVLGMEGFLMFGRDRLVSREVFEECLDSHGLKPE